jgi:hypothetical protein
MSGRGATTFLEIEGLVAQLARMDEPAAIEALRRFAREMQARELEDAADAAAHRADTLHELHTPGETQQWLRGRAARIREGER